MMVSIKSKRPEHLESYHGNDKFSFVNATIWQCIKFWIMTKLTGGIKSDERQKST